MVQLIEEKEVELMETEIKKDGGNRPDPFVDAAINNVVNGHVSHTRSTSPAVDHSLRLVSFSTFFLFDYNIP